MKGRMQLIFNSVWFLVLVVMTYGNFLVFADDNSVEVYDKTEITLLDFSEDVACLQEEVYEWYPSVFYTSEDFAREVEVIENKDTLYGTYRVTFDLEEGTTYMIGGESANYAQNVWINGELVSQVGVVSDNIDDFIAEKEEYYITFMADEGSCEIIIQVAYFNHVSGGVNSLYLGLPDLIVDTRISIYMHEAYVLGALASVALFFIGMYCYYSKNIGLLFFGLMCFFVSLKTAFFGNAVMYIWPNLEWYLGHRLEWIALCGYFVSLFLYLFYVFEWKVNKLVMIFGVSLLSGVSLAFCVVPSYIYTAHLSKIIFMIALSIVVMYLGALYSYMKLLELRSISRGLTLFMVICLAIAAGVERYLYPNIIVNVLAPATLIAIILMSVIFTFVFTNTEKQLSDAKRKEDEIYYKNELLENLNVLKNDYMNTIAHELKTPLTIMGGYAQLTKLQLKENRVDEQTMSNLKTISTESIRLSNLVTKLVAASYEEHPATEKEKVNLYQLVEDMITILKPILTKKGNMAINDIDPSIEVFINYEMILQVYINLTVNANRYQKNSMIRFGNNPIKDNYVISRVEDNGTGIQEDILPHIFDRGYSHEGSSGLGLSICKDIMKYHQSDLTVERTDKTGTSFIFALPIDKE